MRSSVSLFCFQPATRLQRHFLTTLQPSLFATHHLKKTQQIQIISLQNLKKKKKVLKLASHFIETQLAQPD